MKQHYFDLNLLPTAGQRKELRAFILKRSENLSLSTIDGDTIQFKVLARFMKEKFPYLNSFSAVNEGEIIDCLKDWMPNNGHKTTCDHRMKTGNKVIVEDAQPIQFLKKLLQFLRPEEERPEEEKDIWQLDRFEFSIRRNPIDPIRSLRFEKIRQERIKSEVKQACYIFLKYQSAGTIVSDIRAAQRFADYLREKYPKVQSFGEINRSMIENYLLFTKTHNPDRKNRKTELAHLKRVLTQVGKNIEKPYLGRLFIKNDMPKMPEPVFRYYSDAEIERLNRHIVNLEEQVARALILHQMLGGRISDLLEGFRFGEYQNQFIKNLSTGNKKKVFLITGFALRLPLLLLDEPLDGLDFGAAEFLYTAIKEYKDFGSVLMSSHIAESFERTCDKILLLDQGQLSEKSISSNIDIRKELKEWLDDRK